MIKLCWQACYVDFLGQASDKIQCFIFKTCPGLEQYAIKKFAEALETLPKILAENTGVKATEVLSKLYAAHHEGKQNVGVDVEVSYSV